MDWKRAARVGVWAVLGGAVVGAVGLTSFCVALRSDRRSNLVEVPDWIGRGREEAVAQAQSLGLVFEVGELRHDPGVAVDRIVQQEPAPGTQVRHGRTIRVVVSLGGETLTIPKIIGQPARQAELELRRSGLTPGWEARIHDATVPASQVIDESPAPGTLSVSGDRVHRLVSEGPRTPRFVMPDLTGRTLREVQEWITLCGFRSRAVRRVPAEGKRPGTIVGQLPLSGYPVARRDVVELTVAE
jgi:eukaryotic-like serine/threonine-protein kinase